MLKQRLKKTSAIYMLLTLACGFWVVFSIETHDPIQQSISLPLFNFLNPIGYLVMDFAPSPSSDLMETFLGKSLLFGLLGVAALGLPLWSIFFGWVLIRGKDWLNHFPVLGKRVF